MSVSLITSPAEYAFSGDQLKVSFQCTNTMEVEGVRSSNSLGVYSAFTAGETITIKYGSNVIVMTAAAVPDDSGFQFPSGMTGGSLLKQFFLDNFLLNRDYDITATGLFLFFTAKKKALGYDFTYASESRHQLVNISAGVVAKEKANYSVYFQLWCENASGTYEMFYDNKLPLIYGSNGVAEILIGDKLHEYISPQIRELLPDIPGGAPLLCSKSCRKYYFVWAESYGTPVTIFKLHKSAVFTVLFGGMSTIGQATQMLPALLTTSGGLLKFLKQGSSLNSTRTNQRQYLYFFNPLPSFTYNFRCRLRFTDGTKAPLFNLFDGNVLLFSKYGFRVGYDDVFNENDHVGKTLLAYDIWITDTNDVRITETQTYLVDYRPLQNIRYFINWSSWGTMDSRMFYGKGSLEFDLVQSEADKVSSDPSAISFGNSLVYDIKLTSKFSVTTGFIKNRSQLIFNRDFFLSALKYRVLGDLLLPIKVTSKTIPELEDGNNLLAQKFEYQYLFDDHAYTEGDIQEPGMSFSSQNIKSSEIFLTDKEKTFLLTPQGEFITI